jgi:hypothetical protein
MLVTDWQAHQNPHECNTSATLKSGNLWGQDAEAEGNLLETIGKFCLKDPKRHMNPFVCRSMFAFNVRA